MRFACLVAVVGMAVLGGCSSDTNPQSGAGGGTAGGCESLEPAANAEFCAGSAATCTEPGPSTTIDLCGVSLRAATAELARASDVKEFGGSGAPDVGCFAPAGYPAAPGASQTVTMKGLAKIFSHGDESKGLTIEVYTVQRTGGADDGLPGALIGTAVTTPSTGGTHPCEAGGLKSDVDGADRYECAYEYAGVPTETELLVKTHGDAWAELYDYNVYIPNSAVKDGIYEHNVRALAVDDYTVIPQAAIGSPISPGRGVIAGEVHDCGDVRLQNATVSIDVPRRTLTYFSANEDKPMPDLDASATSRLGLYAALDIAPGPVRVAAVGIVGGKPTTLGFFPARVFPDAVTSVTFRGLRPFQLP